jgi:hypothetical protein
MNKWKILSGFLAVVVIGGIIWIARPDGSPDNAEQVTDQNNSGLEQLSDLRDTQTQTPSPTETPSPEPTPVVTPSPTPGQNPDPTPSPTPGQPNAFVGTWNGSFTANAAAAAAGCKGGSLTLTVATDGSFVGYITVDGTKAAGGGTVSSTGKISGAWTYSGTKVNLSGQLSTSSGNGTYTVDSSCAGSFSIAK